MFKRRSVGVIGVVVCGLVSAILFLAIPPMPWLNMTVKYNSCNISAYREFEAEPSISLYQGRAEKRSKWKNYEDLKSEAQNRAQGGNDDVRHAAEAAVDVWSAMESTGKATYGCGIAAAIITAIGLVAYLVVYHNGNVLASQGILRVFLIAMVIATVIFAVLPEIFYYAGPDYEKWKSGMDTSGTCSGSEVHALFVWGSWLAYLSATGTVLSLFFVQRMLHEIMNILHPPPVVSVYMAPMMVAPPVVPGYGTRTVAPVYVAPAHEQPYVAYPVTEQRGVKQA